MTHMGEVAKVVITLTPIDEKTNGSLTSGLAIIIARTVSGFSSNRSIIGFCNAKSKAQRVSTLKTATRGVSMLGIVVRGTQKSKPRV